MCLREREYGPRIISMLSSWNSSQGNEEPEESKVTPPGTEKARAERNRAESSKALPSIGKELILQLQKKAKEREENGAQGGKWGAASLALLVHLFPSYSFLVCADGVPLLRPG